MPDTSRVVFVVNDEAVIAETRCTIPDQPEALSECA